MRPGKKKGLYHGDQSGTYQIEYIIFAKASHRGIMVRKLTDQFLITDK